tara:strand:- start:10839 stop:13448 length:2610 start_codon:yes stop_codon:yes gene_type:complete
MPKLPSANDFGSRPVPQSQNRILEYNGGMATARATEQLGKVIGDMGRDMMEKQDRLGYASAKSALLQKDAEIRQELDADPDYGNYAQKYNERMGVARAEVLKAMGPNAYRGELEVDAGDIGMRGSAQVADMSKRREADHGIATLNTLLDTNRSAALSAGDQETRAQFLDATNAAIEGAKARGYLSETQAVATRQKFAESYAKGSLSLMSPAQRIQALNSVDDRSPLAFLQPDDRAALKQDAERDLLTQQAKADAFRAKANAGFNSDFEIGLRRGEKGYDDIEQAYKSGRISPNDRTQYTVWLDANLEKIGKERNEILRVEHAGVDAPLLDPANADDRKALNKHFDLTVQNWVGAPADEVVDRSVGYAAQKGMVPDRLKGMIRGNLRAGDADQQVMASDTLQKLRTVNPDLLNDFSTEDISRGNLISQYVSYGATPADAVTKADEATRLDPNVVKARDQEFSQKMTSMFGKEKSVSIAENTLAGEFDEGWFSAEPTVGAAAAAEYNTLLKDEYRKTGNMEAAQKTALDMVKKSWGVSRVGGEATLMKYAPEKYYSVPGLSPKENAAWMKDQLSADIQTGGMPAPESGMVADMHKQFPWTAGIDFNFIDSRGKGDPQGFRGLEYYPSNERDNPKPGKTTVEVFGKNVTPTDLMGDLLSHQLPRTDPQVANYRQQILSSMTPEQVDNIHGDYDRAKREGHLRDGQTFKDWLSTQGGDSFFRGFPTGQWSPNDYTSEQKQIFANLDKHLVAKYGSAEPRAASRGLFASDPTSRLSLINNPKAISRDGLPLYSVVLTGEDGVPRVVTDQNGLPLAWRPDYSLSAEGQRRAAEKAQTVEAARLTRENNLLNKDVPFGAIKEGSKGQFGLGLPGAL